jgi:hypothetical protein
MIMFKKALVFAFALGATLSHAYVVVDKTPDIGAFWQPLSAPTAGTEVYTNSFIFTGNTGDAATVAGTYMRSLSGGVPTTFQFLLLADNANSPSNSILASSAFTSTGSANLTLVTGALSANSLVNGTRYWIALSTWGGDGASGSYQVGGHTQNSIYNDNGTFWYSNADTGFGGPYDGQRLTPEMAIYVEAGVVPEPATMAALGMGALALIRRKRKSA